MDTYLDQIFNPSLNYNHININFINSSNHDNPHNNIESFEHMSSSNKRYKLSITCDKSSENFKELWSSMYDHHNKHK